MDIQARIEKIERTLNKINAERSVKKDMIALTESDCFFDAINRKKEITFQATRKSIASLTMDFSLSLGSIKVYLNGVILTQLKAGDSVTCMQIGLTKGDNKISFDLSASQGFAIKKLTLFGYVAEKDFGSNISSFLYEKGAFLSEYNGAKRIARLKYIESENTDIIKTFTNVKFFAMSPIGYTDKAVLIAGEEDKITCYLFDLVNKEILFEVSENASFKGISASKNGSFFVIESSACLSKYIFDESLEYSVTRLDLFAKKVISSPQVSSFVVIDLADKAALYQ